MNFIKKNGLVVGILAVLVIVIVAFFSIGNGITKEENSVDSAYADIDTQLQRRNDLILTWLKQLRVMLNMKKKSLRQYLRHKVR
jgi:hypothetical protein